MAKEYIDPYLADQLRKRGQTAKLAELEQAASKTSVLGNLFTKQTAGHTLKTIGNQVLQVRKSYNAAKDVLAQATNIKDNLPEPARKTLEFIFPQTPEEAEAMGAIPIPSMKNGKMDKENPAGYYMLPMAGLGANITKQGLTLAGKLLKSSKITSNVKGTVKQLMTQLQRSKSAEEAVAITNGLKRMAKNMVDLEKNRFLTNEIDDFVKKNVKNLFGNPAVKSETTRLIATKAAQIIEANPGHPVAMDTTKRLFQTISEGLKTGELLPQNIPVILKKYNITPQAFGEFFEQSVSEAGSLLGQLGHLGKLRKQLAISLPDSGLVFKKEPMFSWGWFGDGFRRIESTRRGMMVTQMATAARNNISQGARYSMGFFEDVVSGLAQTVTGKKPPRSAFVPAYEDLAAVFRKMTKTGRKRVEKLLDTYPEEGLKLINKPLGDMMYEQKVVNTLNFLNSTQEIFWRKIAFDAKITSEMIASKTTVPSTKMLKEAVEHGLELTFAKTPKGSDTANWIVATYNVLKKPFFTAIGNPYPRFMINSLKFLWDFNPTGLTGLLNPKLRQGLAAGDQWAWNKMSRVFLGSTMLAGSVAIRNSELAGPEWYQIRLNNGKLMDTRAFAPFSTYLFLAEAMNPDNNLEAKDWAAAILSLNRISGTGLVLIDVIKDQPKLEAKVIKEVLGSYVSGFTMPFRTVKDFMAQVDPNEGTYPYSREAPFISPIISSIPLTSNMLPKTPSLYKPGPIIRESPALRQLTGITIQNKNKLEQEISRLNLKVMYPSTSFVTIDRLITETAGKVMGSPINEIPDILNMPDGTVIPQTGNLDQNQTFVDLLDSSFYENLPDLGKEQVIKNLISAVKSISKEYVLTHENEQVVDLIMKDVNKIKTAEERVRYIMTLNQKGLLTDQTVEALIKKLK